MNEKRNIIILEIIVMLMLIASTYSYNFIGTLIYGVTLFGLTQKKSRILKILILGLYFELIFFTLAFIICLVYFIVKELIEEKDNISILIQFIVMDLLTVIIISDRNRHHTNGTHNVDDTLQENTSTSITISMSSCSSGSLSNIASQTISNSVCHQQSNVHHSTNLNPQTKKMIISASANNIKTSNTIVDIHKNNNNNNNNNNNDNNNNNKNKNKKNKNKNTNKNKNPSKDHIVTIDENSPNH
ncbi:hypothetical protein BCR32DRAFT_284663 [Anaeromyces robustus]|uniref:Uncharacterized protein n=1 Tax=Anaeromyces robustus TaxID=1754192 RepID=A0A1Y1WR49_9FUNG|nr:hypothetical protein BCR32DRAFT_284663 [Anaeromyces robustus]|eukprot:ORX76009.1 hypothetical protein BCR32DRAFT_284663 [Anaeromyces robustus]